MFGRRSASPVPPAVPDEPARPAGHGSKGRPTPKRSEAERERRERARAPQNRREAARLDRERARATRARRREALLSGDERALPARDRGPVRGFVRDYVDGRRSVAEYFLYVAFGVLLVTFLPSATLKGLASLAWLVMVVLIGVDSLVLSARLRRALRARFPSAGPQELRGTVPYGLLRSLQVRRLRLPRPRVKPGRAARRSRAA